MELKGKAKTTLILIALALCLGAVVGGILWILLKTMSIGIELVWEIVPKYFDFTLYPLVVCIIGGVIIGAWQKKFGKYPEELNEVMGKVKANGGYPYDNLLIIAVAALLPLIFGGCIGPEAGMTGVIAGLCTWVGNRFENAAKELKDLTKIGISAALSVIFFSPLFGFIAPIEEENEDIVFPKKAKMILYFSAIFSGLGIYKLLGEIFGSAMTLARFDNIAVSTSEVLWFVPIVLLGIAAGYLYHFAGRGVRIVFAPLEQYPIIKAVIGGAILGGMGILLPYTMFAGETQMEAVMEEWQIIGAAILFLTGFIKLIIGNICVESGWRGGNIFPIIFSGVCIGYAMALLTGIDGVFAVAAATSGLSAMILRKPIMTAMVLLLCFPVSCIIVIIIAAFIGSSFPLPKFLQKTKELEENSVSS